MRDETHSYKVLKYGRVNDTFRGWASLNIENAKIYHLWNDMFRRCKDTKNSTYKYYKDVVIDKDWYYLSKFASDIKELKGYSEWLESEGRFKYALDKDILGNGKVYNKASCQFISMADNSRESFRRNQDSIFTDSNMLSRRNKISKVVWLVDKGGIALRFNSMRECAKIMNISRGDLSMCYRGKGRTKNNTVKGYRVIGGDK